MKKTNKKRVHLPRNERAAIRVTPVPSASASPVKNLTHSGGPVNYKDRLKKVFKFAQFPKSARIRQKQAKFTVNQKKQINKAYSQLTKVTRNGFIPVIVKSKRAYETQLKRPLAGLKRNILFVDAAQFKPGAKYAYNSKEGLISFEYKGGKTREILFNESDKLAFVSDIAGWLRKRLKGWRGKGLHFAPISPTAGILDEYQYSIDEAPDKIEDEFETDSYDDFESDFTGVKYNNLDWALGFAIL
jgi:hypothetical protein